MIFLFKITKGTETFLVKATRAEEATNIIRQMTPYSKRFTGQLTLESIETPIAIKQTLRNLFSDTEIVDILLQKQSEILYSPSNYHESGLCRYSKNRR